MSTPKVQMIGLKGLSAYEVAVKNGFEGTETEWLESLKGAPAPEGSGVGGGIIDVTALPETDINEAAFYRLWTGTLIVAGDSFPIWKCYCVETLPETGDPILSGNLSDITFAKVTVYYCITDESVYAYVTDELYAVLGVPIGWYPLDALMSVVGYEFKGVITDIGDDPHDGAFRLLLTRDLYVYKNEWSKAIMAYESLPKFNITWDGDMTDRIVVDLSALGFSSGHYLVKVSDIVPTMEEVIGGKIQEVVYYDSEHHSTNVSEKLIDTTSFPGAFVINGGVTVVHSSDELATALGIPTGIYTNGVYFTTCTDESNAFYVSNFTAPANIIQKIDSKYLDLSEVYDNVDNTIQNEIRASIMGDY